jgi:hypothetical protein
MLYELKLGFITISAFFAIIVATFITYLCFGFCIALLAFIPFYIVFILIGGAVAPIEPPTKAKTNLVMLLTKLKIRSCSEPYG